MTDLAAAGLDQPWPNAPPDVFIRSTASDTANQSANAAAPASNTTSYPSQWRSLLRAHARVSARPPTALPSPHTRLTAGEESLPASGVRWVCCRRQLSESPAKAGAAQG